MGKYRKGNFSSIHWIIIKTGVYKSYGGSTKCLWDKDTGISILPATMSLKDFCTISRYIRLYNKPTHPERRSVDKLAVVRNIWKKWVEILPKLYHSNDDVAVDDQ
ncbi:DDE_Tnp_1_7 domain-containing protein [Nephila pilipes]|uniref:DDE_Tnp_1_7 domain-containing protein n=1 Tax=Nephila pilipes TaxID=299642 RepID=A0A8X6PHP9_NEPPI|nr:DDE_Tnp_1_7 domain-containing protein [Nephila pilipes]